MNQFLRYKGQRWQSAVGCYRFENFAVQLLGGPAEGSVDEASDVGLGGEVGQGDGVVPQMRDRNLNVFANGHERNQRVVNEGGAEGNDEDGETDGGGDDLLVKVVADLLG